MTTANKMPIGARAFLEKVENKLKAFSDARALYQHQLAPSFNPFDFISPDENRLSTIIAWLLNPGGSHAQGGRFLDLFCTHFNITWPDATCTTARVRTEYFIDNPGESHTEFCCA
jgi:hypothetical protein